MKSNSPNIVVTGDPEWGGAVASLVASLGYGLICYADPAGYVPRLAADDVALIVVDGDNPDWQTFAALPAANAATRRIPVVVVADESMRTVAGEVGVRVVLHPADLAAKLPGVIGELAFALSPADAAQLQSQCQQPLPPIARQGIERFNAGQYYKQHDSFEELWMLEAGPVRDLYRAILQVGVAYYQIERGNRNGALKMLLRAAPWLARLPDVCQGVDVARLRADARRAQSELEKMENGNLHNFDRALLRPVRLVEA